MVKDVNHHTVCGHWMIISLLKMHGTAKPIRMTCSMKRKSDPSGDLIKWKLCLCNNGVCKYLEKLVWYKFSRFLERNMHGDYSSIDNRFVHAFKIYCHPQADIKKDFYMIPPKGNKIPGLGEASVQIVQESPWIKRCRVDLVWAYEGNQSSRSKVCSISSGFLLIFCVHRPFWFSM